MNVAYKPIQRMNTEEARRLIIKTYLSHKELIPGCLPGHWPPP